MASDQYTRKQWIAYFHGSLDEDLKKEMKAYLDANPELKESIDGLKYLENPEELAQIYDRIDAKIDQLIDLQKSKPLSQKKTINLFNREFSTGQILAMVAAFAILASIAIWVIQTQKPSLSNEQLYAMYYKDFDLKELQTTTRGKDSIIYNHVLDAFNLAASGSENAIQEGLDLIQFQLTQDSDRIFYSGLLAIQFGNPQMATDAFESYLSYEQGNFKDIAKWYYALSLIKTNQNERAKLILREIMDEKSVHHNLAKEMLKHF